MSSLGWREGSIRPRQASIHSLQMAITELLLHSVLNWATTPDSLSLGGLYLEGISRTDKDLLTRNFELEDQRDSGGVFEPVIRLYTYDRIAYATRVPARLGNH